MVANMAKEDNNRLPLRAVSMHAVRTIIRGNEIIKTVYKGRMLEAVLEVK